MKLPQVGLFECALIEKAPELANGSARDAMQHWMDHPGVKVGEVNAIGTQDGIK